MTDWSEVKRTNDLTHETYNALIAMRRDEREGTRKVRAAEEAFVKAVEDRLTAVSDAFDPELDDPNWPYSSTLMRFYRETMEPKRGGKRGRR